MKKMKKFLLTALAALVTFSSCGGALADAELPYTTYNYDYWGDIVYTPAAYVPAGSITGASFQYNGQSLGAFKNPQDLCVAQDGTVYLADSGNNRIVLLSSDMTKVVRVITGFENHGVTDTFQTPTGVAVASDDTLYIADSLNRRVVVLNPDDTLNRIIEIPQLSGSVKALGGVTYAVGTHIEGMGDLNQETDVDGMKYRTERFTSGSATELADEQGTTYQVSAYESTLQPLVKAVTDSKGATYAIAENGKSVILLPGPPGELIPMFEGKVYDYLNKLQPEIIYSTMVRICGLGESFVENEIRDLIDNQTNPTIATYAKIGQVDLRVTAKAASEKEAAKLAKPMLKELVKRFGDHIYTMDEHKSLEEVIVHFLKERSLTLTTAESCTGGMIAARITDVPGASEVFKQGLVTYSNRAKRKLLDVKKTTLKEYGAVSEKTAKEMAKNGAFITGSDACVSVTGTAGPTGGTEEKPVGLVYIGCCYNNKTVVKEFHFKGERQKIREQATANALILLRECILADKGQE